jgi:hypothetical protein
MNDDNAVTFANFVTSKNHIGQTSSVRGADSDTHYYLAPTKRIYVQVLNMLAIVTTLSESAFTKVELNCNGLTEFSGAYQRIGPADDINFLCGNNIIIVSLTIMLMVRLCGLLNFSQMSSIIQNYCRFLLCPPSSILETRKHNVPETGSVSVLR